MIRSFLAVDLPLALRESMISATMGLRTSAADVKWIRPEGIHLTLKFLGNIEEGQIEPIVNAVSGVITDQKPLALKAEGMGAFPDLRRPRVIWIGMTGDIERLMVIQKGIEQALSALGFPAEDRPFTPHLTLGRVRSYKRTSDLAHKIEGLKDINFNPFTVTELILYKSTLRPEGAIYTPLRRLPLIG
ncbi:MAG: RNA 2',3'-cyclic phosphodiesterase [Thermodesulfobacteriota bacterium]